jgi:hypothetical protein
MDGGTSEKRRNGDIGYDSQRPAMEELKTMDDDYGGGCYDRKGVKRAAVFREKGERTRCACVEAKDHGQAGATR